MGEKEVKCATCGMTLTAASEDALVSKLRDHTKQTHGMEVPEEKAKAIAMGAMYMER